MGLGFLLLPLLARVEAMPAPAAYQRPPAAIRAVLDAPPPPAALLAPSGDRLLLAEPDRYPDLEELARPQLRLAGTRFNPVNRTLTPFGYQNEARTLWEAPETYLKVSPFLAADRFTAPILLIHGEADENSGTFPFQSERLFQALKGNGKPVRYVALPLEGHAYQARESVEHVLWEMIRWLDQNL